jgi:hypothetical protein
MSSDLNFYFYFFERRLVTLMKHRLPNDFEILPFNDRDFQVDEGLYPRGHCLKDQDIANVKDEQDHLEFFRQRMKVGGQGISRCLRTK